MFGTINTAKQSITVLRDSLEHKDGNRDQAVFDIIAASQQVFDIAQAVEQQDRVLTADEITDIGEQGLTLIDALVSRLAVQQLDLEKQDVEQAALAIARWVIAHHGRLTNIQTLVDGLAYLANTLHDKPVLSELALFMGQVTHACSDAIKHDLDNSNPQRPWRILNINRGIVATRSQDLDLMQDVFSELIQAIPMDAPEFFQEGMSEMLRLNYPEPVCELMQEFRDRTTLPAVH